MRREERLGTADFRFEKRGERGPGSEQGAADAACFNGVVCIEEVGEILFVRVGAASEVKLGGRRAILAAPVKIGGAEVEWLPCGAVARGRGGAHAGWQTVEPKLVELGTIEDVEDSEVGGRDDELAAETAGP